MKRLTLIATLFVMSVCTLFAQDDKNVLPIELLDIQSARALCKNGEMTPDNPMMQNTYVVAGTFNPHYNASTGTYSHYLPAKFVDRLRLQSNDAQFELSNGRGAFTSTKVTPEEMEAIEANPCTMAIEVRLTGKIDGERLLCTPVRVMFRGIRTGEDYYTYVVPGADTQN